MTSSFLLTLCKATQNRSVLPLGPWPLFWAPNPTKPSVSPPLRYLLGTSKWLIHFHMCRRENTNLCLKPRWLPMHSPRWHPACLSQHSPHPSSDSLSPSCSSRLPWAVFPHFSAFSPKALLREAFLDVPELHTVMFSPPEMTLLTYLLTHLMPAFWHWTANALRPGMSLRGGLCVPIPGPVLGSAETYTEWRKEGRPVWPPRAQSWAPAKAWTVCQRKGSMWEFKHFTTYWRVPRKAGKLNLNKLL